MNRMFLTVVVGLVAAVGAVGAVTDGVSSALTLPEGVYDTELFTLRFPDYSFVTEDINGMKFTKYADSVRSVEVLFMPVGINEFPAEFFDSRNGNNLEFSKTMTDTIVAGQTLKKLNVVNFVGDEPTESGEMLMLSKGDFSVMALELRKGEQKKWIDEDHIQWKPAASQNKSLQERASGISKLFSAVFEDENLTCDLVIGDDRADFIFTSTGGEVEKKSESSALWNLRDLIQYLSLFRELNDRHFTLAYVMRDAGGEDVCRYEFPYEVYSKAQAKGPDPDECPVEEIVEEEVVVATPD